MSSRNTSFFVLKRWRLKPVKGVCEIVQDFISIVSDPLTYARTAKDWLARIPTVEGYKTKFFDSNFRQNEATTSVPDSTTAEATDISKIELPLVQIKLANIDLSLSVSAMCESGYLISFAETLVIYKRQKMQGLKRTYLL